MGIRDKRTVKHMKDPVRGIFRVDSSHISHIVGTVTAPGIPATRAEHKLDGHGHWPPGAELPVTVDRTDPARYIIHWDEAPRGIMNMDLPGVNLGNAFQQVMVTSTNVGQLPPETVARMEQLADRLGGSAGAMLHAFFDGMPQAQGQAQDQAAPPPHGGFTPEQSANVLAFGAGQPATAVVVEVTDVEPEYGTFPPPGGIADLRLEITKPDGSFSTAVTRVAFSSPERRAAVARVGASLRVRVDPLDASKVAIEPP